jgi:sugar phosphate isomerase/epimerase
MFTMISRRDFLISVPLAAALPALARAATGPSNPVACQANAWQIKPGDFQELLKRVADMKRLGFEAFECNVRFVEGQFANAKEARRQIQDTGMTFYGTHTGLGQKPEYLDRSVEGAASLGAKRFAVSGAGGVGIKDRKLDQEALNKKVEAITRLAKRCRGAGLRLVYHNHGMEFTAGGAEIEALFTRTDPELVFFLLDVGHAFREKADVVAFVARHYQRIDALHLRDIRGKQQVPLGQGELDFVALAAAVRKTGWHGWLTVEEENLSKSASAQEIESILQTDHRAIRKFFGV